jgi:DNA-binding SARP family transcriptional activator
LNQRGRTIELQLLGGFSLRIGTHHFPVALSSRALLALLALHQRPVPRVVASGTLWPDKSGDRAAANLRSAVWRLPTRGKGIVVQLDGYLALHDRVVSDVSVLVSQVSRLVGSDLCFDNDFDVAAFSVELLPDFDGEWLVIERERIRQLRLYGLEAISTKLVERGRIVEGIVAALGAVQIDPLRESSHRCLIAAHLADGNVSEARRQFTRYRSLLRAEVGCEPSDQLRRMLPAAIGQ